MTTPSCWEAQNNVAQTVDLTLNNGVEMPEHLDVLLKQSTVLPSVGKIAEAHGKTRAQVMIRWHLQEGRSAIPKSVRPERITEDFDVFDFELTPGELALLDGLDTGVRGGPEPAAITLETFGRIIPEA
jgi:diketogulonate reductase-like aldo/keto reductase